MAGRAGDVLVYSGAASASSLGGLLAVLGYVLVVNGIGEELGWRGFLADRLLDRHGLRRTATVVWVVWGLWHVPLFWVVSDFRAMSVATVVGWTIGLWVRVPRAHLALRPERAEHVGRGRLAHRVQPDHRGQRR